MQPAKALNFAPIMTFQKDKDPKHFAKSEENGFWPTV